MFNRRNVEDEEEKVRAFASQVGLPVIADIPRSDDILRYEEMGRTVIEGDPTLPVSRKFFDLAKLLLGDGETDE